MNKVEITMGSRGLTVHFLEHVGSGRYYEVRQVELSLGQEAGLASWVNEFLRTGKVPREALFASH